MVVAVPAAALPPTFNLVHLRIESKTTPRASPAATVADISLAEGPTNFNLGGCRCSSSLRPTLAVCFNFSFCWCDSFLRESAYAHNPADAGVRGCAVDVIVQPKRVRAGCRLCPLTWLPLSLLAAAATAQCAAAAASRPPQCTHGGRGRTQVTLGRRIMLIRTTVATIRGIGRPRAPHSEANGDEATCTAVVGVRTLYADSDVGRYAEGNTAGGHGQCTIFVTGAGTAKY